MPDDLSRPLLRYVDIFSIKEKEDTYFVVRDPLEIAASPLVMSPLEFYIVNFFDGQHSAADIRIELAQRLGGLLIGEEQIHKLIEILDSNYYLMGSRFEKHIERLMEEFQRSPVRKAWHAGGSYPENPAELKRRIEDFYNHPQGAGKLNGAAGHQTAQKPLSRKDWRLQAILVPHIDLRVGGACYTHAYKPLLESPGADVYIILGVAHYGGNGFFTATSKDFETPLGLVKTDREFIRQWSKNAGVDLNKGEWAHRVEHSIEFQLPFLQHGLNRPFEIVPVLCGALEPYLDGGKILTDNRELTGLIDSLKRTIRESGKRVVFILSVDLAHIGAKFGDEFDITEEKARETRETDYKMFEVLSRLDSKAFVEMMAKDLIPRKVDACGAAYTLLSLLEEGEGKMVSYDQNLQPDSNSLVSYGSMVFYGPDWGGK